jgi:hypothetical protein
MTNRFVGFAILPVLLASSGAAAQQTTTPTVARITPYVGYMTFGSIANGPLGTRVGTASAPVYGVQAGLDLMPNVSLVGHVGYSASNLEVGIPILGGLDVGDSKVLMYDGGVQLRLPGLNGRLAGITPYIEAGAGAIRYELSAGPVATKSTNFAGNFGGGIDMTLGRSLGIRLMAKDYVGKFDFQEAIGFEIGSSVTHNVVFGLGLNLGF